MWMKQSAKRPLSSLSIALQCPQVLPDRLGGNPKRQSALGVAAVHTRIAASLEQRKDRAILAGAVTLALVIAGRGKVSVLH
jgi:hypothetical protein